MRTAVSGRPRIKTLQVSDTLITAHLTDGRIISVPLACSRNADRYSCASIKERALR